ncbi:MAG: GNAT family N-acetyltransferase [Myxococcaceae bacterium]
MKLRKFKPEDIDQVTNLFYDTVHSVNAADYDETQRQAWAPHRSPKDREKALKRFLENIVYVVEQDGKIIGFGDMSKTGYLDRMFTHKDYQRQGVAALIYAQLEQDARALGLKEITSEVSITAKSAAEQGGFIVAKAQDKEHNGVVFRNYVMKKEL